MSNVILAQQFAASGCAVLPCHAAEKRPLVSGGFKSASTDADQIKDWWQCWPQALVGLPCSNFWVLDIDRPCGRSQADIEAGLGPQFAWVLKRCGLVVSTPRGGLHLYFARTPGVAIRNAAGDIEPGIDSRGHDADGNAAGYIIGAGSERLDGRRYRIVKGDFEQIEQAPRRLLALAHFSARERVAILSAPALRDEINRASSDCWREIFNAHSREKHVADLRSASRQMSAAMAGPLRRQAVSDLQDSASRLAATVDGRKAQVFRSACSVGKYVSSGVLSEAEILNALLAGWQSCGAARKHGVKYAAHQIKLGLAKSAADPLPPVARRFAGASS
jgi:hypothetical protein